MHIRMQVAAFVVVLIFFGAVAGYASPLTVNVNVDSTAMPWDIILNPASAYGINDGTGATIVDASSGISFAAGGTLTIEYVSGVTNAFGVPGLDVDANGAFVITKDASGTDNNGSTGQPFPTKYTPGLGTDEFLNALVGTFTDSSGVIVGTPFWIGNGPTTAIIPVGGTRLQLGINDDLFADNTGALSVNVTGPASEVSPVPEPSSIVLLALGCGMLAFQRRRSSSLSPNPKLSD